MFKTTLSSRTLLNFCTLLVIGCINSQNANADDSNLWKQEIKCGDTRYQITSECQTLDGKDNLNTCKRQTLTQLGTHKIITLPNPSKSDAKGIAKAGNTGRLFVTSWMCVVNGEDQYLHLNYYAGTGRSQYDEYYESYDKSLIPLHLTNRNLSDELITKSIGSHYFPVSVKSIMPLSEDEDVK